MSTLEERAVTDDILAALDQLAAAEEVQPNCMFQLAVMLARVAVEPCQETYKEETAQALMGLIRAKPKSNVVRLFSGKSKTDVTSSKMRAAG